MKKYTIFIIALCLFFGFYCPTLTPRHDLDRDGQVDMPGNLQAAEPRAMSGQSVFYCAKTYGGSDRDTGSVRQTSDGGYSSSGRTQSFGAGSNDIWD